VLLIILRCLGICDFYTSTLAHTVTNVSNIMLTFDEDFHTELLLSRYRKVRNFNSGGKASSVTFAILLAHKRAFLSYNALLLMAGAIR